MRRALGFFLVLTLAALPAAQAHRLDEYLQATLVKVEPGEIALEMNLTPGVAVAKQALALIDSNGDGVVSSNEAAAYGDLLRREMTIQIDGCEMTLKLAESEVPAMTELQSGWGIIRMKFTVATGQFGSGPHRLRIENRHQPRISVYIVNAARPKSKEIEITRQERNSNQSKAEIDFRILRSLDSGL